MLADKRILITGVATEDSIAFATARAVVDAGGRVVLTAFPRDFDAARALADTFDPDICFLLSDHARAITGEVLHVDGGYDAMAAPLRPLARAHD